MVARLAAMAGAPFLGQRSTARHGRPRQGLPAAVRQPGDLCVDEIGGTPLVKPDFEDAASRYHPGRVPDSNRRVVWLTRCAINVPIEKPPPRAHLTGQHGLCKAR